MLIVISDNRISDLFFNSEHPNFNSIFSPDNTPDKSEMQAAIAVDAEEFCKLYPEFNKSADWYTSDFMKRL